MSGGARLVTAIALSCEGCAAGVIANAAGFPIDKRPQRNMKFVYFGAVGDADFNYGEFVELRKKLEESGTQYRIRIFDGQHGWAPPEVWLEALNWMDIRAMAAGTVTSRCGAHPASRRRGTGPGARPASEEQFPWGCAIVPVLSYGISKRLTDIAVAENLLAELAKSKEVKAEQKQEISALEQQARITDPLSSQMQAIGSGESDNVDVGALINEFADLKKRADDTQKSSDIKTLAVRRALGGLVIAAYESGQHSMEQKDYRAALVYFDLAAAGAANPAFAHYQRARVYALLVDKKGTLTELRLALAGGFHEASALDAA